MHQIIRDWLGENFVRISASMISSAMRVNPSSSCGVGIVIGGENESVIVGPGERKTQARRLYPRLGGWRTLTMVCYDVLSETDKLERVNLEHKRRKGVAARRLFLLCVIDRMGKESTVICPDQWKNT